MDSAGSKSDIASFFAGRSVLLTGVTGFLGKVILEKLLRSCPDIEYVFVLIREKNGKSATDRLAGILQLPLFQQLHQTSSEPLRKVVPINGNTEAPRLGLSAIDRNHLSSKVSVIFHGAANVKFDAPIQRLMQANLVGTLNVLRLAEEMKGLKAFVYISTAFSNCNRKKICEIVYETRMTPEMALKAFGYTENADTNQIKMITEGRPNVYTFSKSLAEQLTRSFGQKIPVCIVRPSIVTAAMNEPLPGWVENYNGATGILSAVFHGFLHCLHPSSGLAALDIVPVDLVANLIISAAWFLGSSGKSSHLSVYHCCTGSINPITYDDLLNFGRAAAWRSPFKHIVLHPTLFYVKSKPLFSILNFLLTRMPCQLLDIKARLLKQKSSMMKVYQRMSYMLQSLDFFVTHEFNFSMKNTNELYRRLNDADKQIFNFNPASIRWESYMQTYIEGIRKFVLREGEEDLSNARKRFKRLYLINLVIKGMVCLTILAFILVATSCFSLLQ